jgi:hypothetical protein
MTISEKPIMTAQGSSGGRLLLFKDKIRIERKGFDAFILQGFKGDKDIQISTISAIQFKNCSFTAGYIQFSFFGGQETKRGILNATRDENTVMFTKEQQPAFEAIKAAIETRMHNPTSKAVSSGIDDLEKLAELRDKGILTQAEFEAKKKQILGL